MESDAVESFRTLLEFTDEPSCCRYDPRVGMVRIQRTVKCACATGQSDDVEYKVEQVGSMTIVSRLLMVGTTELVHIMEGYFNARSRGAQLTFIRYAHCVEGQIGCVHHSMEAW